MGPPLPAKTGARKGAKLERLLTGLWKKKRTELKAKEWASTPTSYRCDECDRPFMRHSNLARHVQNGHRRSTKKTHTGVGPVSLAPKPTKRRNLKYVEAKLNGLPEPESPLLVPPVEQLIQEGYDVDVLKVIRENWRFCATSYRFGAIHKRYNIRLDPKAGLDVKYLASIIRAIHSNQTHRYKFNLDFAIILWNQTTKEFRYYWPGNAASASFYSAPVFINSGTDLENRLELLESGDVLEHLSLRRPDTKWTVHSIVNLHVSVYTSTIGGPLMGATSPTYDLPDYLRRSRSVKTLYYDSRGKPYQDKLCFWRCLSGFLHPKNCARVNQSHVRQLMQQYAEATGASLRACSKGVRLDDLMQLEKVFEIRVFIYSLVPVDGDPERLEAQSVRIKSCLRKAEAKNGDMYLDLFRFPDDTEHLSLVCNFATYAKWFSCKTCGYGSSKRQLVQKHERCCNASPEDRVRSSGGGYEPNPTVFDRLVSLGITVDESYRFTSLVSAWDLETLSKPIALEKQRSHTGSGLCWEATLELISASLVSTVPGFCQPRFFKRESSERELVDRLVDYMVAISEEASRLNRERVAPLFESIDRELSVYESQQESGLDDVRDFAQAQSSELRSLRRQLEMFVDRHCFFSFNGARFDVKLLRNHMWNSLMDRGIPIQKMIKRNGSYILVATEKIMLKDASCFCGPGCSLEGWVKSVGLTMGKTAFPYDHIDSMAVLDEQELPPQSAFHSSLKNSGISDEDYEQLKITFKEKKWTCLWDMLKDYNDNDVVITLEALKRLMAFWKELGFDVVTEASSIPGISSRLLHKLTPDKKPFLFLPDKKNYDMFTWALKGVVGGPSIVFRRLACAGVTPIRSGPNVCGRVYGFDANSLYLYCLSLPMPTSLPCKWTREKGNLFRKEFCLPNHVSVAEVEYCHALQHQLGEEGRFLYWFYHGGQKRLGKLRRFSADAVSFRLKTVWSMDGCYYHVCDRCDTGKKAYARDPVQGEKRRQDDLERDRYIKNIGFSHVRVRGCEWRKLRTAPATRKYLEETLYTHHWTVRQLTEQQLLVAVQRERFFGLLSVDIHCPPHLEDYLAEFPPLFLNTELTRDHLSEEMRQFAQENDLLKHGRRTLVSVRSAQKILLISPMLKWLLDKGLYCTKVHLAYEFKPFRMYEQFASEVIHHRSSADHDENLVAKGNTWKVCADEDRLFCESLMAVERFQSTSVCDSARASRAINLKCFRQLESLGDDVNDHKNTRYELTVLPRRFTESNPRYIGLFVLGYAKIVMLDFYYGFLRKFWDIGDFEMVYTDTGMYSMYLAISSRSWAEHETKVKPELRSVYETEKPTFLAGPDNQRQPGVFKIECVCEVCVALNSKTYICAENATDEIRTRCRDLLAKRTRAPKSDAASCDGANAGAEGGVKLSAKGVNKRQNPEVLRIGRFLDVLENRDNITCCNTGFRSVDGKMYKFSIAKKALSYFYGKRICCDDFGTKPLW